MKPFQAKTFYNIGRLLQKMSADHALEWRPGSAFLGERSLVPARDELLSAESCESLRLIVPAMINECRRINLRRATQYAEDVIRQLQEHEKLTNGYIAILLRELDNHIRWDMEEEMFMYVPPSSSKFYDLEKPFRRTSL